MELLCVGVCMCQQGGDAWILFARMTKKSFPLFISITDHLVQELTALHSGFWEHKVLLMAYVNQSMRNITPTEIEPPTENL